MRAQQTFMIESSTRVWALEDLTAFIGNEDWTGSKFRWYLIAIFANNNAGVNALDRDERIVWKPVLSMS